jgi:hypothetical protein
VAPGSSGLGPSSSSCRYSPNLVEGVFSEGRVLSGARAFTEWHHFEYGKVSGKEKPT